MIKPKDIYIEALKKIETEFWEYYGWEHCKEEIDLLQELVDEKYNNPTEEEVLKEFEKLGYEWWEYKEQKVFEMCKYDKTNGNLFFQGKIEIDLDDKEYWSDIQFTIKEHQLLTKLFKVWGWVDE